MALIFFGLALGSFVNALVWRLHQQENAKTKSQKQKYSIMSGRSICPKCKNHLAWFELIPLFSWLFQAGKCRHCQKPISAQYPLVELTMAVVFIASYHFWPTDLTESGQKLLFVGWLLSSVALLALAVYDLRWSILPSRIIYPALAIALSARLVYIFFFESQNVLKSLWLLTLSILISAGFFWLLFQVSKGKWIGYGDIRLGFLTGTLLADPLLAYLMIFIASLLGSLAVLPGLISGSKKLNTQIPYGPFLILATAILVIFGDDLVGFYQELFKI